MRIVLFDGIQETHVASSLERALIAAGHEVYNTGRFGKGFTFRDTDDLLPTVQPHLDRIVDFRPDWVLVFRPGSAPFPILQALRSTGASLAVWLSDDPVLFDLSYGPVIDLYDLILHCGNETVLRFYEDWFGRPTGVNFPFWTDHHAFPAVYGQHEPDTTALFLGNVDGPVRRRRYDQLASMSHRVRIFGQVGSDPAGLGSGFLDTDGEVVDAGSRTRVALSIPQFFRDHRGLRTWFPGLDNLGFFDLPSRVIQYSAMGIPTVSIIPGVSEISAFPELVVCESFQEADEWISDALGANRLRQLSQRTLERFDRSFSAAARVRALESLMTDDSWRVLNAADRALWFMQFDGRESDASDGPASLGDSGETQRMVLSDPLLPVSDRAKQGELSDVAVIYGHQPARFSPLDVVLRELRNTGAEPVAWGPEHLAGFISSSEHPFTGMVDANALLEALRPRSPRLLVLAEGLGLAADGSARLRQSGIATLCLVRGEQLTADQAGLYDLVVRVGPAPVDRVALLQGLANAVQSPGIVETQFLEAVRDRKGWEGSTVVRTGENVIADWAMGAVTGPSCDVLPQDLATAEPGQLAGLLARHMVYLQPSANRGRQAHHPVTPYAVCASPAVVTTRHDSSGAPDIYSDWLIKAASPAEAALKLARRDLAPGTSDLSATMEDRHRTFDARRQMAEWFGLAIATATTRQDSTDSCATGSVLVDSAESQLQLDHRYVLDTATVTRGPSQSLNVTLTFADAGLVRGLRLGQGDRTVAEAHFPMGSASAVEMTVAGRQEDERGPLFIEILGDHTHRLRDTATVQVVSRMSRGPRIHGISEDTELTAYLIPVTA